jgi:tellurite resistance protein TerC
MEMFEYIGFALSGILVFVGTKMVITPFYHIPTFISVAVIIVMLLSSIAASVYFPKKAK